jgi:hypothetical protein
VSSVKRSTEQPVTGGWWTIAVCYWRYGPVLRRPPPEKSRDEVVGQARDPPVGELGKVPVGLGGSRGSAVLDYLCNRIGGKMQCRCTVKTDTFVVYC